MTAVATTRPFSPPRRYDAWLRWLSIAITLGGFFFLIQRLIPVDDGIQALQTWLESLGPIGPIVFGVIYVVAALLLLPGAAVTLAGGAVFGLGLGTITVSLASTTTAALAFLISRYLARDLVAKRIADKPKFKAVDQAIAEGGWRIVALLRLSPAVPFSLQNYMYGLTGIRFWPCVLASWIAMLPGTLMYVYLGTIGRAGLEAAAGAETTAGTGRWILLIGGLVATIVVSVYITKLARRKLDQLTDVETIDEPDKQAPPTPAVAAGLSSPTLRWAGVAVAVVLAVALSFPYGPAMRAAVSGWFGLTG